MFDIVCDFCLRRRHVWASHDLRVRWHAHGSPQLCHELSGRVHYIGFYRAEECEVAEAPCPKESKRNVIISLHFLSRFFDLLMRLCLS